MILFSCLLFVFSTGMSQDESTLEEKYERYYEAILKVDFRNYVLKALELTEEEINAIDPLLRNYMNQRIDLVEQKLELVADYEEEMLEDDSKADEIEETSDFIENYWEVSIEEMQLKKRYFDLFEGRIPYQKALEFFMLEEELQYQVTKPTLLKVAPVLMKVQEVTAVDTPGMSYNYRIPEITLATPMDTTAMESTQTPAKEGWTSSDRSPMNKGKDWKVKEIETPVPSNINTIQAISNLSGWMDTTRDSVDLDHAYTHDALNKITAVLRAMIKDGYFDTLSIEKRLQRIDGIADKLQENWKSTQHADWTKEAFMSISKLMGEIQTKTAATEVAIASVTSAAQSLDKDELLTQQADKIYSFVAATETAFTALENKNPYADASKGVHADATDQ